MSRIYPTDLNHVTVFQQKRDEIQKDVRYKESNLDDFRRNQYAFLHKLEKATRDFLNVGVAILTESWKNELGNQLRLMPPINYFKQIAQEKGRPFLCTVEHSGYLDHYYHGGRYAHSAWKLTAPKTPRLKNIISPLLLVAQTNFDVSTQPPVVHEPFDRTWVFWFFDEMGVTLMDDWLNRCKTDPIFRVCLNLDPYFQE